MKTYSRRYARGDDELFVERLYHVLQARGLDVCWDRVAMPSRLLTFHQEIREAIAARTAGADGRSQGRHVGVRAPAVAVSPPGRQGRHADPAGELPARAGRAEAAAR